MSDQSTISRTEGHEESQDKFLRIKAFVSRFAPGTPRKEIRAVAYKEGFGPIPERMLADARAALWPEFKPKKAIEADNKYLTIKLAVDTVPCCPHCNSDESLVYIARNLDDKTVRRRRTCKQCNGTWYSVEQKTVSGTQCGKYFEQRRVRAMNLAEKECTLCRKILPAESFPKKDSVYYHSRCRECRNQQRSENQLKQNLREHGVSIEEYESLLSQQNGGCAICGLSNVKHSHGKNRVPLVFDHCHVTGKFRGMLCQRCNRALGLIGDNAELLEKSVAYLRSFQERGIR